MTKDMPRPDDDLSKDKIGLILPRFPRNFPDPFPPKLKGLIESPDRLHEGKVTAIVKELNPEIVLRDADTGAEHNQREDRAITQNITSKRPSERLKEAT